MNYDRAALTRACPKCGAGIGEKCKGPKGERKWVHRNRHMAQSVDKVVEKQPEKWRKTRSGE